MQSNPFTFQWWDWSDFVNIWAATTPLNPSSSSSKTQWPSRNPLWCKSYAGQTSGLRSLALFFQLVEHTPAWGPGTFCPHFLGCSFLIPTSIGVSFHPRLHSEVTLAEEAALALFSSWHLPLPDICIFLCLVMVCFLLNSVANSAPEHKSSLSSLLSPQRFHLAYGRLSIFVNEGWVDAFSRILSPGLPGQWGNENKKYKEHWNQNKKYKEHWNQTDLVWVLHAWLWVTDSCWALVVWSWALLLEDCCENHIHEEGPSKSPLEKWG